MDMASWSTHNYFLKKYYEDLCIEMCNYRVYSHLFCAPFCIYMPFCRNHSNSSSYYLLFHRSGTWSTQKIFKNFMTTSVLILGTIIFFHTIFCANFWIYRLFFTNRTKSSIFVHIFPWIWHRRTQKTLGWPPYWVEEPSPILTPFFLRSFPHL